MAASTFETSSHLVLFHLLSPSQLVEDIINADEC
jgi:hypothetical protein